MQRAEGNVDVDLDTKFQLHRNLGWALVAQKRYEEAKVQLKKAWIKDSQIAGTQIGGGMETCFLAQIYEQEGDLQKARDQWKLCREHARPETINEYKWFLNVGDSDSLPTVLIRVRLSPAWSICPTM